MDALPRPEGVGYDFSAPFLLASGGTRLIQIQPTQFCNLRCAHCYSESGPDRRGELALDSLTRFLGQAGELGYRYVGVSGGEPLLWSGLEEFLRFAREGGFSTSVTTNGTLMSDERARRLRDLVGVVAVSVDGPPAEHAKIRCSETAFGSMQKGLAALRKAGVPFTLAFTLTRFNADRLSWLYEFADAEGAAAIHVHPLCNFGAASVNLSDAVPDSREFRVAGWLLALLVGERGPGGPTVTLDAIRRSTVEGSCWPLLEDDPEAFASAPISDLVPSLVVETDGCISPFIYGFPREWALGSLDGEPLRSSAEAWRARSAIEVRRLVRETLRHLAASGADFVDLFGEVLATAGRSSARAAQ